MAFEDRSYSGSAVPAELTANISNVDTTILMSTSAGWPDGTGGPFHIRIDSEVIRVSGRVGNTLTVQTVPVGGRGWDATTASAHIAGAIIEHVYTATDADEANQHYANTGLDHHTQYLTVGRHDIAGRHGFGILPTAGTPSTSSVGDTATAGASNNVARIDHRHAREGFGSPVSAGPTNADGAATTVARSNHVHAGGIPILTSGTRPGTPIDGQTIIESDTNRVVQYDGTKWVRGPWFASSGRTGFASGRTIAYSIPDAGASSYVIPWSTEVFDSDGFSPPADGTTTYTATIPSVECEGLYIVSVLAFWGTLFSQRSYVEIIYNDGVGGIYQYRATTTGDDRVAVTATIQMTNGQSIQVGAWQNSGSARDISYFLLRMTRIGA